jgi:uncharacterized protein DUF6326
MATINTVERQEARVNVRLKLSALWTCLMFFYAYADLLAFFDAKTLRDVMDGNLGVLALETQALKLGVAVMMSVPAAMIFVSLALKATYSRWANIVAGAVYTLIAAATLPLPSWLFYKYFECLEVLAALYVVWSAWNWPTQTAQAKAA